MGATEKTKASLAKILGKLEARSAEGYGRLSFQAKALGKSKDSIHLAVENGIISVPLSEIESISQIPGRSELELMVDVRNGSRIEHLRRIPDQIRYPIPPGTIPDTPFTWPPRVPPGGYPDDAQDGGASSTTGDCNGIDTSTTSGGGWGQNPQPDQTDDYRQYCWHDKD
jgi:hypothetical protein